MNASVIKQICAHVNQVHGIRFQTLLTLCEQMEKQQYIHASKEVKSRRHIHNVMCICENANQLLLRIEEYSASSSAPSTVAIEEEQTTFKNVQAPLQCNNETKNNGNNNQGAVVVAKVLIGAVAKAPIVDQQHMSLINNCKIITRELHRARNICIAMENDEWSNKLIVLVDRTIERINHSKLKI
jgi:hypothetical protein